MQNIIFIVIDSLLLVATSLALYQNVKERRRVWAVIFALCIVIDIIMIAANTYGLFHG